MKHNYTISTKSIQLLPLSHENSQNFRILRNREDNRNWFKSNSIISEEAQSAWYEKYLATPNEFMFSVHDPNTMSFLGAIGLYDIDFQKKQAEMGRLLIDRKVVGGRGLGTEAVKAISKLAFTQLTLNRIYSEIYSNNLASIRALEKAHFQIRSNTTDSDGTPMVITELTKEVYFNAYPPSQT